jgi:hypothetical protein
VAGRRSSGRRKFSPSSPPVKSLSCEARVRQAEATASVIMAKKIALTRSEARPISSDSSSEAASAPARPMPTEPQPGPSLLLAMATP